MARTIHRDTGIDNLVLAGGVALNCVVNGQVFAAKARSADIWIQPAAGDAGGALGAAFFVWHQLLEKPRRPDCRDAMHGSLLGPRYATAEIEAVLQAAGASCRRMDEPTLLAHTAQALADGKVVGWFQGRMEFGPRALGCRSILGDPRLSLMQATMNLKIKFRESFRPFAPCVLREHAHEWFDVAEHEDAPYMLTVAAVTERHRSKRSAEEQRTLQSDPDLLRRVNVARSTIPAVTHLDYSARVQTVDDRHGRFQRLLRAFHARTGCPVLVNTSFNLSWEPIVNTPEQAYRTFMQSEMDVLVLENFVVEKSSQRLGLRPWTAAAFAPDADSPWSNPMTGEALIVTREGAVNPVTGRRYPVEDEIPRLFVAFEGDGSAPRESRNGCAAAAPGSPAGGESARALVERGLANRFARLLNDQIPYSARVVDVGCGTGQLAMFLAIAHRSVIGVDSNLQSLRVAATARAAHGLERVVFAHSNPLRPALRESFFDYVICRRLDITGDTHGAFRRISRLVRPGGYIVVALHNRMSRVLSGARGRLIQSIGLNNIGAGSDFGNVAQRDTASHSLGDVCHWFAESGCQFVNAFPRSGWIQRAGANDAVFQARQPEQGINRWLTLLTAASRGISEDGFFFVVGQRDEK